MDGYKILRIFVGIVFLSAGIYKVFHIQDAYAEIASLLPFPGFFTALTIILEIVFGICLTIGFQAKKSAKILFIFVGIALITALIKSPKEIFQNFSELFFFNTNPTDFFLHLTYAAVLFALVVGEKK